MLDFLKRNFRWITIFLFLIISLQIITYDISHPESTGLITRVILTISSYPLRAIHYITDSINDLWEDYVYLVNVKKENDILKKRIDELLTEIQTLKEYRLENERLRKLLGFSDRLNGEFLSARIIGITQDEGLRVFMIDRGSNDGVREGSAVLVPEGIVGRAFRVSSKNSLIMLITDPRSNIDVRFERTRVRAILHGTGNECEAEFVKSEEDVVKGDRVVTSGLGGIFPEGILAGIVRNVETKSSMMFKKIIIEPSAHLDALEEVMVMKREGGIED